MTNHVQKEPRRKPKYGLLSCVAYIYRILWKYERRLAFVGIVTVPISLCLAALALYLPSEIISVLETSDRFSYIALVIAGLLLAKLLLDTVHSIINTKISLLRYSIMVGSSSMARTMSLFWMKTANIIRCGMHRHNIIQRIDIGSTKLYICPRPPAGRPGFAVCPPFFVC